MMRAEQDDIETVFLGFSTWLLIRERRACAVTNGECGEYLSRSQLVARFLSDLSSEIRELRARGRNVIVCLPFPIYDRPIPALEISNAVFGRFGMSEKPIDTTSPDLGAQIRAVAVQNGATIFDPRVALCKDGPCLYAEDGVSIYKDDSHVAKSRVKIFEGSLRDALVSNPSN